MHQPEVWWIWSWHRLECLDILVAISFENSEVKAKSEPVELPSSTIFFFPNLLRYVTRAEMSSTSLARLE